MGRPFCAMRPEGARRAGLFVLAIMSYLRYDKRMQKIYRQCRVLERGRLMPVTYQVLENHITLDEILEELNKKELMAICRQHGLRGYSTKRKQELADQIRGHILKPEVVYAYFLCLSDEEVEYMRMEADCGGIMEDVEPAAFSYLIAGGYAGFNRGLQFGIPAEVLKAFEALDNEAFEQERRRVYLIGNYCYVANYLYGITPPMQVVRMFNQYERHKTDWKEVMDVYEKIHVYRCDFVYKDYYFVDHAFVRSFKEILDIQGSLPYYMPAEQELEEWFQFGFSANQDAVFAIYSYMTRQLWADEYFASDVCYILESTVHVGCSPDIVYSQLAAAGLKCRTRRQEREFQELLGQLINHTRMIIYRGHTPVEAAHFTTL